MTAGRFAAGPAERPGAGCEIWASSGIYISKSGETGERGRRLSSGRSVAEDRSGAEGGPEKALLARVRAGSPEALASLYEEHGGELLMVAHRLTGSRADAEDVVQDVFLGLPEMLRRHDVTGSVAPWLRQVTTRLALMRLRRQKRRERWSILGARRSAMTWDLSDRMLDRLALEEALDTLPESLRVIFVLKEVFGYTHQEIANLLGITASASQMRLYRSRQTLAKLLWSEP